MKKDLHAFAERYMRDQVAIMKKHGSAPSIGSDRFDAAVRSTQRAFEGLASATSKAKTKEEVLVRK
jgi:hypothetical protein